MKNKFILKFEDDSIFEGKSFPKSDWKNAPDKKIKIFLYAIESKLIQLEGYKQYNHLIEQEALMNGKTRTSRILLMGRKENETQIVELDFKKGKLNQYTTLYGKEYGKQILTGWKEGILDNPNYKIANSPVGGKND